MRVERKFYWLCFIIIESGRGYYDSLKFKCAESFNFHNHNFILAGIYLLKVNNRNIRARCEISSELTIKTPERRHWRLTLNMYLQAGIDRKYHDYVSEDAFAYEYQKMSNFVPKKLIGLEWFGVSGYRWRHYPVIPWFHDGGGWTAHVRRCKKITWQNSFH